MSPHATKLLMDLVLNDDVAGAKRLAQDEQSRAMVHRMCVSWLSTRSGQWMDLLASWGVNLREAPAMHNGARFHSLSWQALALGRRDQLVKLLDRNDFVIDVDAKGKSGLLALAEGTLPLGRDRFLDVLELLADYGFHWSQWPDGAAVEMLFSRNSDSSLSQALASRSFHDLELATSPVRPVSFSAIRL